MTEPRQRRERRAESRDGRRSEPGSLLLRLVRPYAAGHVAAGLLGLVGPLVEGNDDRIVNVEPGLFLGAVAVNGRHAMLHVCYGLLGLPASRDRRTARGYLGLGAALFGALAAVGFRRAGFERGVHLVMGMAVDVWGTLAHAGLAALNLLAVVRSGDDP